MHTVRFLGVVGLISFSTVVHSQQLIADFCFCNPDNILQNDAPGDWPDAVAANPGTQTNAAPDVPLDETGIYNNQRPGDGGLGAGVGVDIPASIFDEVESLTLEFDVRNQKESAIILINAGGAENAENDVEGIPFQIANKTFDDGDGIVGLRLFYYTTADLDNPIQSGFIPGSQIGLDERATVTFIYDQETGIAELFKNGELVWETPADQRTPGESFYLETKTNDDGVPILSIGQNMNEDAPQTPSLYSFRATDAACPAVTPPTVRIPAALCGEGTVTLQAEAEGKGDGDFRWYATRGGRPIAGAVNSTYSPAVAQTTTYFVSVQEGPCESERIPVEVRVIVPPPAPVVTNPERCEPGTFTLRAESATGNTYRWYTADGTLLARTDQETTVLSGQGQGTYTTDVLSETTEFYVAAVTEGCAGERSRITASVLTPPPPPTVSETILCQPETTTLTVDNFTEGLTYRWYDQATDGTLLEETATGTREATVLNDTIFYVSTWSGSCESERVPLPVTIYQTGSLDAGPDDAVIPDGKTTLRATDGYARYEWYPTEGLSDPTAANPVASPEQTTTYWVTAVTAAGCEDTDQITVEVVDYPIPNAFTPNGDGLNDRWELAFLERYPDCRVTVYNRWGNAVYSSQGYANPWDGRDTMQGTYTYVINLGNGDAPIQGTVVVL